MKTINIQYFEFFLRSLKQRIIYPLLAVQTFFLNENSFFYLEIRLSETVDVSDNIDEFSLVSYIVILII